MHRFVFCSADNFSFVLLFVESAACCSGSGVISVFKCGAISPICGPGRQKKERSLRLPHNTYLLDESRTRRQKTKSGR